MKPLEGKVAIVTGATKGKGLGKAIAVKLAEQGAKIVLVARNEEKLQSVLSELPGDGHQYIAADFEKPEELKERIQEYVASGGESHILINNTGGPPGGQAIEADIKEFRIAFNNHLICN